MKTFIFTILLMASLQIPCELSGPLVLNDITLCSPTRAELGNRVTGAVMATRSTVVAKLTYEKQSLACAAVTFAKPAL